MEDRELIELAAKACGIRLEWDGHPDQWQPMYYEGKTYHSWNPLEDDGDAFRLAVKTGQALFTGLPHDAATYACSSRSIFDFEGDSVAANRRVVVMAAAEIGSAMP